MRNRLYDMTRYLLASLCVLISLVPLARASDKDFPPKPVPAALVNDLAHFMDSRQVAMLESKLVRFSDSTSNQIAIVTVQSIGPYEISDYSVELFNRWQIGTKEHKNGVLILAAKDERKIWITTGYGLEGALPDGLVGQIIREQIQPSFKEGDFYTGLDKGTDAIMAASRGEYKGEPKTQHNKDSVGFPGALLIIIIIFVVLAISRRGGGGGGGGLLNSAGWIAASMLGSSGRSSGSSGWGGGGGGGFGGFGGGSSGGGGAGGSW